MLLKRQLFTLHMFASRLKQSSQQDTTTKSSKTIISNYLDLISLLSTQYSSTHEKKEIRELFKFEIR